MTQTNGFSENAQLYASSPAHAGTADLEAASEHIGDPDGWDLLDVATGTGHTAFFFGRKQANVFAVDINDEMLEVAQEEADRRSLACRFLKGAADDLPFDDATFDLVTCRLATHHFPNVELFLKEAFRVLRPGGQLLIIDNVVPAGSVGKWINEFEQRRDPSHQTCLTEASWKELFQAHQFSEIHLEVQPQTLDFDLWMERMSISGSDREDAWERLLAAPSEVVDYLQPQKRETRTFTLHRLIALVGRG